MNRTDTKYSTTGWVRFVIAVVLVVVVNACATVAHGPAFSQSRPSAPPPGSALVYVFRRDAQPTAWGATVRVSDQNVATLNQGGFTWAYLRAGKRQIKAAWPVLSGQTDSSIELDLAEGSTHYVELVGVSKVVGISAPFLLIQIGSGMNEISASGGPSDLEKCCVLQAAAKSLY